MTEPNNMPLSRWIKWPTNLAIVLAIGGAVLWLLSAVATGADIISFKTSLGAAAFFFFASLAGVALLLVMLLVMAVKKRGYRRGWAVIGLIVGLAFTGYIAIWLNEASNVPAIHDVSTDLTSPPTFDTLTLRSDNREVVPDGGRPELAAMDNAMRWRALHAEAYGDIQPIIVPTSVPETIAAAEQLVNDRGWELAVADPATGRLEATETVSLYRFKDDVVLRVVPNPDGPGSIVDMRSVSRVGVSDLGVNAARVRSFLADLLAATAS